MQNTINVMKKTGQALSDFNDCRFGCAQPGLVSGSDGFKPHPPTATFQ